MEGVLIKVAAFVAIIVAGYCAGRRTRSESALRGCIENRVHVHAAVLGGACVRKCPVHAAFLCLFPIGLACAFVPYVVAAIVSRRCERGDRVFYMLNICGFNIGCFCAAVCSSAFFTGNGRRGMHVRCGKCHDDDRWRLCVDRPYSGNRQGANRATPEIRREATV